MILPISITPQWGNVKLKKVKRISYESQHGRVATYSDTVMSNKARLNSAQGVSAVYKADDISLSDYVRVVYEIENE
jgi:hypothetical protein